MNYPTDLSFRRRPLFFRRLADYVVRILSVVAVAIAVGGMTWILYCVINYGVSSLNLSFLANCSKPFGLPDGGIGNAIAGTVLITLFASLIAIPLGIAGGIYLSEFGKHSRIANALRFCANVMMGMPSVLVGLFVYIIFVVPTGTFSGFAGALALGIIMFPVIMRTTEDMLAMVPYTLRESALALGMTRARTTMSVVCRSAKNGLVTGVLLAVARVSGETAPLLFTAMFADAWPKHFFSNPTANVPVLITQYADSPFGEMQNTAWGAAFVITSLVLALNILTRIAFREQSSGK